MESPLDFEDRFPLQLFFYSLPLKHVETKKRGFGLFFYSCARHGALRASATSLAMVATLVTWR